MFVAKQNLRITAKTKTALPQRIVNNSYSEKCGIKKEQTRSVKIHSKPIKIYYSQRLTGYLQNLFNHSNFYKNVLSVIKFAPVFLFFDVLSQSARTDYS